MKTQIKKLIKLAEDFREFSQNTSGRLDKYYCENKVWCYFADRNNYTSVHIDWANIDFHSLIQIEFKNPDNITPGKIKELIKYYSNELKELKVKAEEKSQDEIYKEKQDTIKTLEAELKRLKNESN